MIFILLFLSISFLVYIIFSISIAKKFHFKHLHLKCKELDIIIEPKYNILYSFIFKRFKFKLKENDNLYKGTINFFYNNYYKAELNETDWIKIVKYEDGWHIVTYTNNYKINEFIANKISMENYEKI